MSDFDLVIDNATYIVTSDSKNRVLKIVLSQLKIRKLLQLRAQEL